MKKYIFIIITFLVTLYSCYEKNLIKQGNELIIKIESYKKQHGFLPASLSDIGIQETEEGPLYYDKKDSINYIIWFGTSLGESVTYHSDSNKWYNY
jgi:hypothetical protein